MAADRELQVLPLHADPVVGDAHQGLAAGRCHDIDGRRMGIDGIFDKFLDHTGRPLDNLTGRYPVDHRLAELSDLHSIPFLRFPVTHHSYMVRRASLSNP